MTPAGPSDIRGRFARELRARRNRKPWLSGLWYGVQLVLLGAIIALIYAFIRQISNGGFAPNLDADLGPGVWRFLGPLLGCLLAFAALLIFRAFNQGGQDPRLGRFGLRRRLIWAFSAAGIVPTILTLALIVSFLSLGFRGWINRSLDQVLVSQQELAIAYEADLRNRMGEDMALIAQSVAGLRPTEGGQAAVRAYLEQAAASGGFWQLYLYDSSGRAQAGAGPGQGFDPILSFDSLRQATEALDKKLDLSDEDDLRRLRILTLVPGSLPPLFVYGSRVIDAAFLDTANAAQAAAGELRDLNTRMNRAFYLTGVVMAGVTLILLLIILALGLWFAGRLIEPIGNIIAAARDMGQGSLDVRVPVSERQFAEYRALSDSFNTMAGQLEQQRDDLQAANRALDERRQFTSAVLAGVSAGVLGLDAGFGLTLPNVAASDLLGLDMEARISQDIRQILPEFAPILASAGQDAGGVRAQEIRLFHKKTGNLQILLASVIAEFYRGKIVGYVLTFDDVSELASAQRQSAWAEVARQIAHEIKNPLTPIQLSAERLRRRFSDDVAEEGREVFALCLDTIARQVETISRLVNEFSSFSRMPKASLNDMDLAAVARQAFFLQASGFDGQDWQCQVPEVPVMIKGDQALIGQAIQNLLKNAGEAVADVQMDKGPHAGPDAGPDVGPAKGGKGAKIILKLELDEAQAAVLSVEDSGPGFDQSVLERVGTPYVSTKQSGTGLGLAIVKKIMEDHGGGFTAKNQDGGGARIRLTFPAYGPTEEK